MFFAFASVAANAHACQCINEYEVPTCAMYWNADFVFVARVKSISARPSKNGMYPENTRVRLQMLEVFHGGITGEVLDSQGNGADCLVEYEKGKRFLIYAHDYNPTTRKIITSTCSGSKEITTAREDYLTELRELSQRKEETSIFGRVVSYETYKPMSGVEVMLYSKGQTFSTATDAEGLYNFVLKHEGVFNVSVIIPYDAFDGGYYGIKEASKGPNRTSLEYEDSVPLGQCHFKELLVVKLPYP